MGKKEDKIKIIEKYKVGDIIKGAEVKGYSTFGCFFNVNGELDVLVHLQEISYSRVNHPDEVFNIGEKHDLKVISVDKEKLQVGCSVKQLSPDPFEHIENYELNKVYKEQMKYEGFTRSLVSTARNFNLFNTQKMYQELGKKKIDASVIWGDEDEIVSIDGLSHLKLDYPEINYKVIENGHHDLTYALPSIVGEFLSQQLQSFSNSE